MEKITVKKTYADAICKSQMHLKEVILDGNDISKEIIDYATNNAITDIVVGASTKNTFIRYITCSHNFHDCAPLHPLDACTDNSHDHYIVQKI
jgi:K+-sensing histidine kinase KdpD